MQSLNYFVTQFLNCTMWCYNEKSIAVCALPKCAHNKPARLHKCLITLYINTWYQQLTQTTLDTNLGQMWVNTVSWLCASNLTECVLTEWSFIMWFFNSACSFGLPCTMKYKYVICTWFFYISMYIWKDEFLHVDIKYKWYILW